MRIFWARCRDQDAARRLRVFILIGSLNGGHPTPARFSPISPAEDTLEFYFNEDEPSPMEVGFRLGRVGTVEQIGFDDRDDGIKNQFPDPEADIAAFFEEALATQGPFGD